MKRVIFSLTAALIALGSIGVAVASGSARSERAAWFANLELRVTAVTPVGFTQDGLLADVNFQGSAGGPNVVSGNVVGVDHATFDLSGNAHLNAYLTVTDIDGDQISANVTGLATPVSPGNYVLQGTSGTIIDTLDPGTGTLHPTTGKYAQKIGQTFTDVGFITDFSISPPGGSIHVKWYLN